MYFQGLPLLPKEAVAVEHRQVPGHMSGIKPHMQARSLLCSGGDFPG